MCVPQINVYNGKKVLMGSFPLRAWSGVFLVSFIDKQRIKAQAKNAPFHARSGNKPMELKIKKEGTKAEIQKNPDVKRQD